MTQPSRNDGVLGAAPEVDLDPRKAKGSRFAPGRVAQVLIASPAVLLGLVEGALQSVQDTSRAWAWESTGWCCGWGSST